MLVSGWDGPALFPSGRDFLHVRRNKRGRGERSFSPGGDFLRRGRKHKGTRGGENKKSGSGRSATRLVLSWFSYVPDGVFGFSHGGLLRQWRMRTQAFMYISGCSRY